MSKAEDWPPPTYEDMSEVLDVLLDLWGEASDLDQHPGLMEACERTLKFLHRYGRLKSVLTEDDIREHYCH